MSAVNGRGAATPSHRALPLLADAAGGLLATLGALNFAGRFLAGLGMPCDFTAYYLAGRAFLLGEDYYRQETVEALAAAAGLGGDLGPFLYPPLFAAMVSPLSHLDYVTARLFWFALTLFCLAVGLLTLTRTSGLRLRPGWRGPALAFVVLFPPVFDDLLKGQVTTILLALLGLSASWARSLAPAAGLAVAMAGAIKLSPALVAVQFALRGNRRALAAVLVAGGALAMSSLALAGPALHLEYAFQALPSVGLQVGAAANISLPGLLARLFDPRSLVPPIWPNASVAGWATPVALCALGGFYVVALRRGGMNGDNEAFGLTLTVMLLGTPSSQAYTLVLALFPLAVLLAPVVSHPVVDWRRFDLLVVAAALLAVPPDLRLDPAIAAGLGLPNAPGGAVSFAIGALPTIGLLVLACMLVTRPARPPA